MSVIHRIEVANLLNKHGDIASPWDAKMRHLLLDLRGQSSAISMENGFGKTTLAEALIGMLSRDRTLLTRTRRKCSPSNVGGQGRSWTHLRVEFRTGGSEGGQDDMLATAGEEVAGESVVFGMYGYCDGSGLSFYHYAGRLEQVPIHHETADGKLALYANSDVQAAMRAQGVSRSANREEWLDAVGAHVSRRELAQLASFQKEGGADKSQIFNAIKPRGGEKADQAFFFEVLAPQILSGATHGETDEGEDLIEEVILNSGTKVTELRHRLSEAETDQHRAEDKVAYLESLNAQGQSLLDARNALVAMDATLSASERLIGGQALMALPGIPNGSATWVEGFAWGSGDTGRPRVSLWLLARLTRQAERHVRQALSERGARVDSHRRLIHLPEASWPAAKEVGHVAFEAARDWLADSQAFDDDAARYRALAQFDEAAEAFESLDGNRWREEVIADRTYLKELKTDVERLDRDWERLDQEREQLESRQREFTDNQSFYTQALSDGLFSEEELEAPDTTEQSVQAAADAARQSLADHIARVGELRKASQWHAEFKAQHPDTTPGDLLALKTEQLDTLNSEYERLDSERNEARSAHEAARTELERLRGERQRLEGEQTPLQRGREAWQAFVEHWPEAEVTGFWTRKKNELATLQQQCQQCRQSLETARNHQAQLAPLAESAAAYTRWHGDEEPVHLRDRLYRQSRELDDEAQRLAHEEARLRELHDAWLAFREVSEQSPQRWLKDAKARYPRLLRETQALDTRIAERESYLEQLAGDPLASQAAEVDAQRLLDDAGIAYVPLHRVLTDCEASQQQHREWLSQAASHLFAPVVDGEKTARDAANRLIDEGIGVPVIEAHRLTNALQAGQTPLGAIQGVETLAVKAALDPSHLDALRQETQQRLDIDRERRAALDDEIARLDPHGERFALARQAHAAEEQAVETALESLTRDQAALADKRNQLAPRMSQEALASIDDYQRYLQEGGDKALETATQALADAQARLAELEPQREAAEQDLERHGDTWLSAEQFADAGGVERLAELEARLAGVAEQEGLARERSDELVERLESLDQQLTSLEARRRSLFADGERDWLRTLDDFEREGGEAFMQTASQVETELNQAVTLASRRADFDFARIRAYLEVRDARGGRQKLERDIAQLKRDINETRDARKARLAEQSSVESRLEVSRQAMGWVDQLAVAWLERLRELPAGWRQRLAGFDDLSEVSGWPDDHPDVDALNEALSQWHRLAGPGDEPVPADVTDDWFQTLEASQQTLLQALGELNLGEHSRQRDRQARELETREQQLARSLDDASGSRLFNDTERARLATLNGVDPGALAALHSLHDQLVGQLGDHRDRVAKLHASREHIEGTLVERLGSIITDAAGNLDILKRVARRSGDGGAFFDVKASLIDDTAVRELIQQMLADIDEHQAAQRRRQQRGEDAGESSRRAGDKQEELARQIRRRIYRGLFRDVSIRLKHDAIRPHGRLFSLNEDMSEGQREAVSLMWLVKLSEFAIERGLHDVPGARKRRGQGGRESVILLDGLFSKLSHRRLIQDSLESLRNTRGRFQMIGLIHNPNYENDPGIFPTYLVGSVIGGQHGQGGHVVVREGQVVEPTSVGRDDGDASIFGIHVTEPAVE
ncbi:coiled-coil domain-containing protein [Aidingimonas lacisalsi]|uniref:hypothetical protein n=1 Tax=Aidingimonas lacisalsi TaxID=2604086 RepID=UPI0011D2B271|nr:hypothetical protein [Aidingimonas lacisalsi]